MSDPRSVVEVSEANRARELLVNAQQALWGAMYYVRNHDIGISETQLKRAIQCVEKLGAQIHCADPLPDEKDVAR